MKAKRYQPTAVIGAGRLARALLPRLDACGYPVVAVAARSVSSARRAIRGLPGARATTSPARAVSDARLVLLAVPDREIGNVAERIAREVGRSLRGKTVLHHAGALGIEPLRPIAEVGAAVGVMHPFQVLSDPDVASKILAGSLARIEGDRRGVAVAFRLAKDLGLVPYRPHRAWRAAERSAYHAAASLVSNDLLALLDIAEEALVAQGMKRAVASSALTALARGTLAHVEKGGIEAGLTGPVARGDIETIAAQLRSLARLSPDAARVHRILSRRLLGIATRESTLPPFRARALRRILNP